MRGYQNNAMEELQNAIDMVGKYIKGNVLLTLNPTIAECLGIIIERVIDNVGDTITAGANSILPTEIGNIIKDEVISTKKDIKKLFREEIPELLKEGSTEFIDIYREIKEFCIEQAEKWSKVARESLAKNLTNFFNNAVELVSSLLTKIPEQVDKAWENLKESIVALVGKEVIQEKVKIHPRVNTSSQNGALAR